MLHVCNIYSYDVLNNKEIKIEIRVCTHQIYFSDNTPRRSSILWHVVPQETLTRQVVTANGCMVRDGFGTIYFNDLPSTPWPMALVRQQEFAKCIGVYLVVLFRDMHTVLRQRHVNTIRRVTHVGDIVKSAYFPKCVWKVRGDGDRHFVKAPFGIVFR